MICKKYKYIVSCFAAGILTAIIFCTRAEAVSVDATDISGRNYAENVLKELDSAKREIYVAMYSMYVRYGEEDGPACKLVDALKRAQKRGVFVRVYLDKSPVSGNDARYLNKGNDDAYKMLKDAGVVVSFIKPALKLHDKLIVIDGATVIDGSTNWTNKALLENEESAQVLRGEEFAQLKLVQINELEKYIAVPGEPRRALLEKVRIRNSFLEDKRFAPRMVTESDEYSFDLYLILLKKFKEDKKTAITLNYAKCALQLGIKVETKHSSYRQEIRRLARNLKEKYGLIDYRIDEEGVLEARLLDYDSPSREYSTPESGYFNIPVAYWEYGLDRQLLLREKFAYMVATYEQEIARPRPRWRRSLKGLSEKYHIDEWTFAYGLRQLKKLDLIEVRHSRVRVGEQDFAEREPNEYRLKELIASQEKERIWKELEDGFGAEMVKAGREFAGLIDEGNNVQAVRDFIRLINRYGQENVREAAGVVSQMEADNPLRSINYIVGVLRRMEREKKKAVRGNVGRG